MQMINLTIDGTPVSVPAGTTVLEAARKLNIDIPTLCFLKEINAIGACRICVVENRVNGMGRLVASCVFPVAEGMEIYTHSPMVQNARKKTLELILSDHDKKCLSCVRSGDCELQRLCNEYGVDKEDAFEGDMNVFDVDDSAVHMIRNNNKCILCRRCVAVCDKLQGVTVIGANERGFATHIGSAFDDGLGMTSCVSCGQCIVACPTGALTEKDDTDKVWAALADPTKHVVVQVAPSIRVTLGESFDMPIGTNVEGKMVTALKKLGFDKVFDTNVTADLTIMEEANELIERVQKGGVLPMITSCSPGWIKYCEHYFPDMIPHLSSCKSPQQMFGAVLKTYYAEKNNIDPKDIVSVSVMPCTAKKFEVGREDQSAAGIPDVDISITTRELARMIKRAGIVFPKLEDGEFDHPLGIGSGAGLIFGATGGVMEAALRTAVETLTGEELGKLDFEDVRGTAGIKEAAYKVGDLDVKVAVCSGLANAKELLKKVQSGEADYTFIEIMGCPGGCVNGGGQPYQPASVRNYEDLRAMRAKALYDTDAAMTLRKSHENPVIKELYDSYFDHPGSHKAHEVLHTSYVARNRFGDQ
ncbi:MAG: iron hydrogenase small subunit [Clostridia bacterium]|nr:iron hydrogenase small subunit [Clostridia bacterium]